jgi:hypothetical protein
LVGNTPVYKPPSSPSSILPPGNATCASRVFRSRVLMRDASSAAGFSRRRNNISGRAPGSFTQSNVKNSDSVGCVGGIVGGGAEGGGTTRIMRATAARRGSVNK